MFFTTLSYIFISLFCFSEMKNGRVIKLLFHIIYYTYIVNILIVFLINPGIPQKKDCINNNLRDKNKKYIKCRKCNIIVPEELKMNHCSYCEVCIIKHDHHCIWTGKCIGKNNIIFFFIFIFSLFLFILISFFNIFVYLIQKVKHDKDKMLVLF
jgi:hypothetical protein